MFKISYFAVMFPLIFMAYSCKTPSELTGTTKKKEKPEESTNNPPQPGVAPPHLEGEPIPTPNEQAQNPTNILGTFLTANKLEKEDEGRTIRIGITLTDEQGQKDQRDFELTYELGHQHKVNTQLIKLPKDRPYHAIQIIKGQTKESAESASAVIKFLASTVIEGEKVTASLFGAAATEGLRDNDPGDIRDTSIKVIPLPEPDPDLP